MAYRAFADELRLKFGKVPEGVCSVTVKFFIGMPDSWSKKKRQEMKGEWHQQKPDADNLCKAVLDALIPNDERIAELNCVKLWSERDEIEIEVFHPDGAIGQRPLSVARIGEVAGAIGHDEPASLQRVITPERQIHMVGQEAGRW